MFPSCAHLSTLPENVVTWDHDGETLASERGADHRFRTCSQPWFLNAEDDPTSSRQYLSHVFTSPRSSTSISSTSHTSQHLLRVSYILYIIYIIDIHTTYILNIIYINPICITYTDHHKHHLHQLHQHRIHQLHRPHSYTGVVIQECLYMSGEW